MTGHPEWFATCAGSRRRERNLTIRALHAAGGPTKPVVVLAESGKLSNPRPSTLAKFDTGLGWKVGSAAEVFWKGGPPTNIRRSAYKTGAGRISVGLEPVMRLLTAQKELHQQLKKTDGLGTELDAALRQLDRAVSAIAGTFVTETLERNHGQDQKMIHSTMAGLLNLPLNPDDPEYDEKLYRRWLFGTDLKLDETTVKRFNRRLKSGRSQ